METGVAKYNGLYAIAKTTISYLYAFRFYKKVINKTWRYTITY